MEGILTDDEATLQVEQLTQTIAERIEQAEKNPISTERVGELESRLQKLTDMSIERGNALPEERTEEDTILAELMQSSAMAHNIIEFKELLKQVSEKFKLDQTWADELLAHENAHANVLETQGAEWKGYGVIFVKDASGALSELQPLNFSKSNSEWDSARMTLNSLVGFGAPDNYNRPAFEGDVAGRKQMSHGDVDGIAKELERLVKITEQENAAREKEEKFF